MTTERWGVIAQINTAITPQLKLSFFSQHIFLLDLFNYKEHHRNRASDNWTFDMSLYFYVNISLFYIHILFKKKVKQLYPKWT